MDPVVPAGELKEATVNAYHDKGPLINGEELLEQMATSVVGGKRTRRKNKERGAHGGYQSGDIGHSAGGGAAVSTSPEREPGRGDSDPSWGGYSPWRGGGWSIAAP